MAKTQTRVMFDAEGALEALLSAYMTHEGVSERAVALRTLVTLGLLLWDDFNVVADYETPEYVQVTLDVHRSRYALSLPEGEKFTEIGFARYLASQDIHRRGGKRPGAGRKKAVTSE